MHRAFYLNELGHLHRAFENLQYAKMRFDIVLETVLFPYKYPIDIFSQNLMRNYLKIARESSYIRGRPDSEVWRQFFYTTYDYVFSFICIH